MAHLISCFFVLVTYDPAFLQKTSKCSKSPIIGQSTSHFYKSTYNKTKLTQNIVVLKKGNKFMFIFQYTKTKCILIFIR